MPELKVAARVLLLLICLLSTALCSRAQSLPVLLERAGQSLNEGDIGTAKELAYKAYHLAAENKSPLLGKASFELAKTFHISGNFDNATSYYEKALEFSDVHRDSVLMSKVLTSLGVLRISNNMFGDGERNVQLALSISQRTGDRATEARCFSHLGQSKYLQQSFVEALKNFRAAAETAEKEKIHTLLSACLNNMGQCYASIEKYDSAAFFTQQAIELRKTKNQEHYLNEYFTNLTYIHLDAGKLQEALDAESQRFKLLHDSSLTLDAEFIDPQVYIHEQLTKLQHEQATLLSQKSRALTASLEKFKFLLLASSIAIIVLLFALIALTALLIQRKQASKIKASSSSDPIPAQPENELLMQLNALKIYNERMKVLLQSKNDLLPNCYELLSRHFNYAEIGSIIGKDSTTVGRYMSEVCTLLGTNKELLKKEAVELGALIWQMEHPQKKQ